MFEKLVKTGPTQAFWWESIYCSNKNDILFYLKTISIRIYLNRLAGNKVVISIPLETNQEHSWFCSTFPRTMTYKISGIEYPSTTVVPGVGMTASFDYTLSFWQWLALLLLSCITTRQRRNLIQRKLSSVVPYTQYTSN